jgi:hypothetical protein
VCNADANKVSVQLVYAQALYQQWLLCSGLSLTPEVITQNCCCLGAAMRLANHLRFIDRLSCCLAAVQTDMADGRMNTLAKSQPWQCADYQQQRLSRCSNRHDLSDALTHQARPSWERLKIACEPMMLHLCYAVWCDASTHKGSRGADHRMTFFTLLPRCMHDIRARLADPHAVSVSRCCQLPTAPPRQCHSCLACVPCLD